LNRRGRSASVSTPKQPANAATNGPIASVVKSKLPERRKRVIVATAASANGNRPVSRLSTGRAIAIAIEAVVISRSRVRRASLTLPARCSGSAGGCTDGEDIRSQDTAVSIPAMLARRPLGAGGRRVTVEWTAARSAFRDRASSPSASAMALTVCRCGWTVRCRSRSRTVRTPSPACAHSSSWVRPARSRASRSRSPRRDPQRSRTRGSRTRGAPVSWASARQDRSSRTRSRSPAGKGAD
jgi:hypothetical protein